MDTKTELMPHLVSGSSKRVVIVGGGFAGLQLANDLANSAYDVYLLDKNNYHQFQPLFYQVATAGLAPGAISFPLRKAFKKAKNVHFRMVQVLEINTSAKEVITNVGRIGYDYLVMAIGGDTNYFGNKNIMENATPMKSVSEALFIRNKIIFNYEKALNTNAEDEKQTYMNITVVGGGPTGVELAGALAEMKRFVLPKEYPELDFNKMDVYLLEAGSRLLNGMSDKAGDKAKIFLEKLGVKVMLNTAVKDYDGVDVKLANDAVLKSKTLLWAAGIKANTMKGIDEQVMTYGGRWQTDRYSRVKGYQDIFALGDLAYMETERYPKGHPQVAQVALQQAKQLAKNLKAERKAKAWKPFEYKDLGSMATVGKKLAVVDFPFLKFQGFLAWITWLFVHLMALVGVRNKISVFLDWAWNYLSLDPSLRLLIRPKTVKESKEDAPWN